MALQGSATTFEKVGALLVVALHLGTSRGSGSGPTKKSSPSNTVYINIYIHIYSVQRTTFFSRATTTTPTHP